MLIAHWDKYNDHRMILPYTGIFEVWTHSPAIFTCELRYNVHYKFNHGQICLNLIYKSVERRVIGLRSLMNLIIIISDNMSQANMWIATQYSFYCWKALVPISNYPEYLVDDTCVLVDWLSIHGGAGVAVDWLDLD